jgi:hypothetical protein
VSLQGTIREHDFGFDVNASKPLADMQESARRVGAFIAMTKLQALSKDGVKHGIQEIETWDDMDEGIAQQIAQNLQENESVVNLGDDAQLIAGATLTLIANPEKYSAVTGLLNDALDFSFKNDPIWGVPTPHTMFSAIRLAEMGNDKTSHAKAKTKKRS